MTSPGAAASSAHSTPVPARVLFDYLTKRGAIVVRQTGSHVRVKFPNGQQAGVVASQGKSVSTTILRDIATKLGMSYPGLREALGYPVQVKGKPRAALRAVPARQTSKGDVRRAAVKLRTELGDIERDATTRDRDPSVYKRAATAIEAARKELAAYRVTDVLIRTHTRR